MNFIWTWTINFSSGIRKYLFSDEWVSISFYIYLSRNQYMKLPQFYCHCISVCANMVIEKSMNQILPTLSLSNVRSSWSVFHAELYTLSCYYTGWKGLVQFEAFTITSYLALKHVLSDNALPSNQGYYH